MNKPVLFSLFLVLLFIGPTIQRPFNVNLALEMLRASTTSYCPSTHLLSWSCGDACDNLGSYSFVNQITVTITENDKLSYTLLVNRKDHRFVISFRGTNTKTQLFKEIANSVAMKFDIHPVRNAVVSKYFYANYKYNIRTLLLSKIKQAFSMYPDYDYYFVGHSLGGAFATLAALDASMSNIIDKDRIHLYTYGCPRVGDFNFASAVVNAFIVCPKYGTAERERVNNVGEIQRVTHHRDLVPHVPPCQKDLRGNCIAYPDHPEEDGVLTFHAFHVWPEVFFEYDSAWGYKVCAFAEDSTCANQYLVTLSIEDHVNYMGVSTRCMKNGLVLA